MLKIGTRVKTVLGYGNVSGYDMPQSFERYKVALDSGEKYGSGDPCFMRKEVEVVK